MDIIDFLIFCGLLFLIVFGAVQCAMPNESSAAPELESELLSAVIQVVIENGTATCTNMGTNYSFNCADRFQIKEITPEEIVDNKTKELCHQWVESSGWNIETTGAAPYEWCLTNNEYGQ